MIEYSLLDSVIYCATYHNLKSLYYEILSKNIIKIISLDK